MIFLTTDEIINLHEKVITETGGLNGLRDKGLLESAVYGALASYGEQEAYKTIPEKAARLAFSIIKNHPFVDGNKRIGLFVMLMTLRLNAVNIEYSQQELILLGLGIADGNIDYDKSLAWIKSRLN